MNASKITLLFLGLALLPSSLTAQPRRIWKKTQVCSACTPMDMGFADTNSGFIVTNTLLASDTFIPYRVFSTYDGGATLSVSNSTLKYEGVAASASFFPAPDFWVYLGASGYTYYSIDSGKEWMHLLSTDYADHSGTVVQPSWILPVSMLTIDHSIHIVDIQKKGYHTYYFSISRDGGSAFYPLSDTLSGHPRWGYASPDLSLLVAGLGPGYPYSNYLARSTDSGAHWKSLHPVDPSAMTYYNPVILGNGIGHFFLTGGRLDSAGKQFYFVDDYLESTDTGSTWREVSDVAGGRVYDIANPDWNVLWAIVGHAPLNWSFGLQSNTNYPRFADSLFYSSDGGKSWIKDGNTFRGDTICAMRWLTPNNGYVITYRDSNTYLYHYSDSSGTSGSKDTAMTVTPLSWNFASSPIGHTDTATFTISNASSPGVSLSGNISYPTDATFYVPFGTGAFTLSEGGTKKLMVLYTPPDNKARSATMTITGPRSTDHVTINLSAGSSGVAFVDGAAAEFVVVPNPAQSTISMNGLNRIVTVIDALGRAYICPRTGSTLDISRLPVGVYYVSDGGSTNGAPRRARFVKE